MSVIHLSPAAKRWQEVASDPQLSERVERIEMDVRGQFVTHRLCARLRIPNPALFGPLEAASRV